MSNRRCVVRLVAAARPNSMKVAPLFHALRDTTWFRPVLVHTGQHYDREMSQSFLAALRLPAPEMSLEAGSGSTRS